MVQKAALKTVANGANIVVKLQCCVTVEAVTLKKMLKFVANVAAIADKSTIVR